MPSPDVITAQATNAAFALPVSFGQSGRKKDCAAVYDKRTSGELDRLEGHFLRVLPRRCSLGVISFASALTEKMLTAGRRRRRAAGLKGLSPLRPRWNDNAGKTARRPVLCSRWSAGFSSSSCLFCCAAVFSCCERPAQH